MKKSVRMYNMRVFAAGSLGSGLSSEYIHIHICRMWRLTIIYRYLLDVFIGVGGSRSIELI